MDWAGRGGGGVINPDKSHSVIALEIPGLLGHQTKSHISRVGVSCQG